MELIGNFIEAIRNFGVPDHENFTTVDLYEEQNLVQVLTCLQCAGRKVMSMHPFMPDFNEAIRLRIQNKEIGVK